MLSEFEKNLVRELQNDLPLTSRPFLGLAGNLGATEEEVLEAVHSLQERGVIRRFAAILRHRQVGYAANAMVVWSVPEDKVEEAGEVMASFPEVSHCYQRPRRPGWPYNLFVMVHGRSRAECEETARRLSKAAGLEDYRLLFSSAELKKSSMRYFAEGGNGDE